MKWSIFFIFLLVNFGALYLGSVLQGEGAQSDWYQGLAKAPWTPPGWVFGAAWTTVMLTFSIFMTKWYASSSNITLLIGLFLLQLLLNVGWNSAFFGYHHILGGLIVITALTLLVWYLMLHGWSSMGRHTLWILPYALWMIIATSLNTYIYLNNA